MACRGVVTGRDLLLASRELLQPLAYQHLAHVQVADRIDPDRVWSPELARTVATLAAEAANHVAVEIADADVVFELRDIHHAFFVEVHVGRPLELALAGCNRPRRLQRTG